MSTIFEFDRVGVSLGAKSGVTEVTRDITLAVARGEFVSVVGPSGCGKTTLLNLAAGLLMPNVGSVSYCGQGILGPNRHVGYLTQDDALLPWRSVLGNTMLPLEIKRVPKAERLERARDVLERVGLSGFADHLPSELSGGMRKRASLARTLVYRPSTLLLDEPFGALDAQTRTLMQRELLRLVETLDLTVLLVTHDLDEAVALSDRIAVFSARPARILDVVPGRKRRSGDILHRTREDDDLYARLWRMLTPHFDGEAAP